VFEPSTSILVVDDAPAMRAALVGMLTELGYSKFIEATNGNNAFSLLESNPAIGLILCDQNMPECTGIEFLKKIRAIDRYKAVPFVMVTSEGEKQMIVDAITAGASNYVTKPVTAEILKKKLEGTYSKLKK
jgi:two-component system chemotaxis response regulator CheY